MLMAKGRCLRFYTGNRELQEEWITALKPTCILLDLKDEYLIGKEIGRGSFASVHCCTHKDDTNRKKYALKSIEKSKVRKSRLNIQNVIQEINCLRHINHPFVIGLVEIYESHKYIHLVLEHLDGGELFERIKQREVYQESTAIKVMRNIMKALEEIHHNKIVHRDLKPENLILASKDNDYEIKIADFGLASFIREGEPLTLGCGSPGYVAPEMYLGKEYDEKVDIFSAGVILYILLSGKQAFRGYNQEDIKRKNKKGIVEYPPSQWDHISDKAKDIV